MINRLPTINTTSDLVVFYQTRTTGNALHGVKQNLNGVKMNTLKAMYNGFVGLFTSSTSIEHDAQIEGSEVSDEQTTIEKDTGSSKKSKITSKEDDQPNKRNDKNGIASPINQLINKIIPWVFGSNGWNMQIPWLIPYLIPSGTNGLLIGDTGTFKSFIVIFWACCIATGRKWQGYPIRKGLVIYIAGEGEASLARRVKAWEELHGVAVGNNLAIIPEAITPTNANQMQVLIQQVKSLCDKRELPIKLIIFDTLSQSFRGSDENSAVDMSRYILACKNLGKELGATILNVHHTNRDGKFRGSSALIDNVDFSLFVKKNSKEKLSSELSISKLKDSDDSAGFVTKLVKIDLDLKDEYDNPITSLAVEKFEAKSPSIQKEPSETKQVKDCRLIYELANGMLEKSDINTITKKGLALAFSKHVDADPEDDRDYTSNDFGRAFKRLNKLYPGKVHHNKDQDTLSLIN